MPWELGSGNKSDYDFHIQKAYFAPDANYQGGEATLLHLEGIDEDGEECTEMYNVGKDWISPDGGDTVVSTKNAKKINRTSMYGHFIQHAFETNEQLPYLLEKKGDANEAKVWVGLVFHMDEVEIVYGGNINNQHRNMPTAFLGDELAGGQGSFQNPAQTPAKSPQPAATQPAGLSAQERIAAAKAAAQQQTQPVSPPARTAPGFSTEAIANVAKASATHEAFITAVVEIPGVTDDDEFLNYILDPTEKGMYAISRAS